ncbi:MAG: hypothetical protein ACK55O_14815 [Phycisphaerales bacterium]|jgi:hypothetical protein|nr:hypothetical protein [Phycisphaeraceae bacterium]
MVADPHQSEQSEPMWRSPTFVFVASVFVAIVGMGVLLLAQMPGAAIIWGGFNAAMLLMGAMVRRVSDRMLRASSSSEMIISWVMSLIFSVGVIALFLMNQGGWATTLLGIVTVFYLMGLYISVRQDQVDGGAGR